MIEKHIGRPKGLPKTGGMRKGWSKTAQSKARREFWALELDRVVGNRMRMAYKDIRTLLKALPDANAELIDQTPDDLLTLIPAPPEASEAIKTILAQAEKRCDQLIATIRNIS